MMIFLPLNTITAISTAVLTKPTASSIGRHSNHTICNIVIHGLIWIVSGLNGTQTTNLMNTSTKFNILYQIFKQGTFPQFLYNLTMGGHDFWFLIQLSNENIRKWRWSELHWKIREKKKIDKTYLETIFTQLYTKEVPLMKLTSFQKYKKSNTYVF